jgi:hypothetical protein
MPGPLPNGHPSGAKALTPAEGACYKRLVQDTEESGPQPHPLFLFRTSVGI